MNTAQHSHFPHLDVGLYTQTQAVKQTAATAVTPETLKSYLCRFLHFSE